MIQVHAALALLAADDPSSWVEVVLVLIFLLGGMVRSIAKAVKGEGKPGTSPGRRGRTPTAPGRRDESGRIEGLDRWEELLRGEAAPVAPRVEPVRRRIAPPAPEPESPAVAIEPELAHLPSEDVLAEGPSEAELAHLPSEDRAMPDEEQLAVLRDEVRERVPDTFVADELEADTARAGVTRQHDRRRDRWRHAIVSAELVGRPVGLRGPEGGPLGLRD